MTPSPRPSALSLLPIAARHSSPSRRQRPFLSLSLTVTPTANPRFLFSLLLSAIPHLFYIFLWIANPIANCKFYSSISSLRLPRWKRYEKMGFMLLNMKNHIMFVKHLWNSLNMLPNKKPLDTVISFFLSGCAFWVLVLRVGCVKHFFFFLIFYVLPLDHGN